jgi:hypothetical protein
VVVLVAYRTVATTDEMLNPELPGSMDWIAKSFSSRVPDAEEVVLAHLA